jgi:hypothetical protein
MIHFITHADDNYLPQARVMLDSLYRRASEEISGHIICLGDARFPMSAYANFGVYGLDWLLENIDPGLALRLQDYRHHRTWKEFCWALEPVILLHGMMAALEEAGTPDSEDPDFIVYVDADSYFLADPIKAIRRDMSLPISALQNNEAEPMVGLTPHHFPAGQESRVDSVGYFNFGFGVFEPCATVISRVCEWIDLILGTGSGTAGQQSLDKWRATTGFVAELRRGFNVGPWQRAEIKLFPDVPIIISDRVVDGNTIFEGGIPLISYHFHEFRRGPGRNTTAINGIEWNRTNYDIHPATIKTVYEPYEDELAKWTL